MRLEEISDKKHKKCRKKHQSLFLVFLERILFQIKQKNALTVFIKNVKNIILAYSIYFSPNAMRA